MNGRTGTNYNNNRDGNTLTREPRNFGGTGSGMDYQGNSGGAPLKLLNPLRVVRIVEQTPGTTEEIYSSERSGGGGGGRRDSDGGGRGSRPMATAGGIST